jgi:maleate cis-trans isomerase
MSRGQVVRTTCIGVFCRTREQAANKSAKRLYESAPEADVVFVPCPRWPTITDVDLLEREIGKG